MPVKRCAFVKPERIQKTVYGKVEHAVYIFLYIVQRVGCYNSNFVFRKRVFLNNEVVNGYGIRKSETDCNGN